MRLHFEKKKAFLNQAKRAKPSAILKTNKQKQNQTKTSKNKFQKLKTKQTKCPNEPTESNSLIVLFSETDARAKCLRRGTV